MNLPQGKCAGTKPDPGTDAGGQGVFQGGKERERFADVLLDLLLRQSLAKRVNRHKRRQRNALRVGLPGRGSHGIPVSLRLHLAVKAEHRADQKRSAQIVLIEISDFAGAALVKGAEFKQRQPLPNPRDPRRGCDGQKKGTARLPVRDCLREQPDGTAVFVSARQVIQQVSDGPDAEFFIRRGTRLSDAAQFADRSCPQIHNHPFLLPSFIYVPSISHRPELVKHT